MGKKIWAYYHNLRHESWQDQQSMERRICRFLQSNFLVSTTYIKLPLTIQQWWYKQVFRSLSCKWSITHFACLQRNSVMPFITFYCSFLDMKKYIILAVENWLLRLLQQPRKNGYVLLTNAITQILYLTVAKRTGRCKMEKDPGTVLTIISRGGAPRVW